LTPYTVGKRGCTKRGYKSERGAMEAHKFAGYRVRAYFCPDCGNWHTTNAEKNEPLGPLVSHVRRSPKRRVMGLAPEMTLAEVEAIAAQKRGRT
jgi:hypothetical protein